MTKYQTIYQEFGEAVQHLDDALRQEKTEYMRDSSIKRFELAFDLAWKTMKAWLEEKGGVCASPLDCFRETYRIGLGEYTDAWRDIVKIRNKTVHTYDEDLAEEIYRKLPNIVEQLRKLHEAFAQHPI
ncbi:MAG: HI0074 family nucleotidyltransferase substrate-binding subunit [Patescibacteria group bacterium]